MGSSWDASEIGHGRVNGRSDGQWHLIITRLKAVSCSFPMIWLVGSPYHEEALMGQIMRQFVRQTMGASSASAIPRARHYNSGKSEQLAVHTPFVFERAAD